MTTMTGSALLALAVAEGVVSVDEAWTLAHLDEDWTIEHWGEDEEAAHRRKLRAWNSMPRLRCSFPPAPRLRSR